jgi:hypothetical protein
MYASRTQTLLPSLTNQWLLNAENAKENKPHVTDKQECRRFLEEQEGFRETRVKKEDEFVISESEAGELKSKFADLVYLLQSLQVNLEKSSQEIDRLSLQLTYAKEKLAAAEDQAIILQNENERLKEVLVGEKQLMTSQEVVCLKYS